MRSRTPPILSEFRGGGLNPPPLGTPLGKTKVLGENLPQLHYVHLKSPHALANNRTCAPAVRCSRFATRATTQPGYAQINLRQWFSCDVSDTPIYCRNYSAGVHHQPRLFVRDAILANRTRPDKRAGKTAETVDTASLRLFLSTS